MNENPTPDAAKPVILAVDDDPQVLRAVRRDLRANYADRYRVLATGSAGEALRILETLEERGQETALFLVDQRMPDATGIDFLLEAMGRFPDARRVLLTAYADTDAAIAAVNRVRLDYYLMKPWNPPDEHLYPVLDDLLSDWQARHRPAYQGIQVVGHPVSAHAHEIRDFLTRNGRPFQFLDVERDAAARSLHERGLNAPLPLVAFPDGTLLAAPTTAQLADRLGLSTTASRPHYDVVIVGAGPTGLAAGVYAASEGLTTLVLDQSAPGGQAGTSSLIENYLGFPAGLSGGDLARRAVTQAGRFGAELLHPVAVTGLRRADPARILSLDNGTEVSAAAVLLAMGVSYFRLPVPEAERFEGVGLYYGAATTETSSCLSENVFIVGGANSAGQAAVHFAKYAAHVTVLVRAEDLCASMSRYLVDEIGRQGNIDIRVHTEVVGLDGGERLERIELLDNQTGERAWQDARFVFVFIGARPHTAWLGDEVARNPHGFVLTGSDLAAAKSAAAPAPGPVRGRRPAPAFAGPEAAFLETSVPGVFAAGDVRAHSIKRVASGVGEGAMAVALIHRYLSR